MPNADQNTMSKLDQSVLELCAQCERDDIGNGERFRIRYGDLAPDPSIRRALRVAHIGWHVFDGQCYKEDEDERHVRPLAHQTARSILHEIPLLKTTEYEQEVIESGNVAQKLLDEMGAYDQSWDQERKNDHKSFKHQVKLATDAKKQLNDRADKLRKFAKSSAGTSKINALMQEAGPYVSVSVDELNTDRYTINTSSGLLTFEKLEPEARVDDRSWITKLTPHSPEFMVTKVVHQSVDMDEPFEAEKHCPEFDKFLKFVIPSEDERKFLQRYMGLCLTGIVSEQCLLFFLGIGRNGKSTFTSLMSTIMAEYAVTLSIDSFSGDNRRGGAEATPDLARLPGARLVVASEPEAGVVLKEALVKTLTGGEKFPVRRLNKDFFEVDPQFKIILGGNHAPIIKNNDDGIWRRIHLLKWDVQVAEEDVDRDLLDKLFKESDAVFRWMIEGALDYLSFGLMPPKTVREATAEYRQESDVIGSFIRTACDVTGSSHDEETPATLYKAFEKYCEIEGDFKLNQTAFLRKFSKATKQVFTSPNKEAKQFSKRKRSTTYYSGIKIKIDFLPYDTTKTKYGDDE